MNTTSIVRCPDYDPDRVREAMDKSLSLLGGMEKIIRPGMRVLIKCNLLMKKKPEEAATIHPEVAAALALAVRRAGGHPILGDSPGGLYTESALRGIYRVCGLEAVAKRDNIALNLGTDTMDVSYPEGKAVRSLTVIKLLHEADAVISAAKLKTHGMAVFTGAVKNLFGVIPGLTKAEYHYRMQKAEDFAEMLLDVCGYVKPVLSVIDGIVGMEGDGPSAGDPRHVGVLLASENPYALDTAAAHLIGIPPERVPTIAAAQKRGISGSRLDELRLVGDNLEECRVPDFKVPQLRSFEFISYVLRGDNRLSQFLKRYLGPRPVFLPRICVGCEDCRRYCPPGAIRMVEGRPRLDLSACIRCYCCQELCPKKAVQIRRSWLFRTFK